MAPQDIISHILYLTIATVGPNNLPWISPVYCAFDTAHNFYWISSKTALHSENIRSNPHVALVIYDTTAPEGTGDGLYMQAKAYEVTDQHDMSVGIAALNARSPRVVRTLKDITGNSPNRLYKATSTEAWINTDTTIDGFVVDCRKPVNLNSL